MYYAGIDICRKSLIVSILNDQGEIVKSPHTLAVDPKGFAHLLKTLTKVSSKKDQVILGTEATGNLWENVYSFLNKNEYRIILINPHQSRKFHELARRKAKTGKVKIVCKMYLK